MRIRTAPNGAAACASLPLLNDVKDRRHENKKSRRTSNRLNADDTAFWFEPTKPPAARPLRGGTTWFAEIAPSGDRAHGIGPQDRTCPAFPWLLCP